ncbi:protein-L-isoaspartate(D-aspartate) O-methyltransferase [Gemmatimonadota bacterium]
MEAGRLADSYGGYRSRLVEVLRTNGIEDMSVLRAFGEVPRHLFVPEALRLRAYEDMALPIGHGQTISQPTTQAKYLQALCLTGFERVLEVGTGSGYQAALLAKVASQVVSVERIPALARSARRALAEADTPAVTVLDGDGSLGWKPLAPYDAILVAAASPAVPQPLLRQLRDGGRLVVPVADGKVQKLKQVTRNGDEYIETELGEVQFVPLIGRHGYEDNGKQGNLS